MKSAYNIRQINNKYKKSIKNNLITNNFCPFRYEKQMDYLLPLIIKVIKKYPKKYRPKILEAGCGYGRLIYFINKLNLPCEIWGIDYMKELIDRAKENFKSDNIRLKQGNIYDLSKKYKKFFDIVISYKTLSWLPDYKDAVKEMMTVAKNKVYITSLFYDGDISFETRVRQLDKRIFTYLNTYSLNEFKKFCIKNGAKKVVDYKMNVDFDIPKPENVNDLKTFTIKTTNTKRLEVTGTIILNWRLIEINLK